MFVAAEPIWSAATQVTTGVTLAAFAIAAAAWLYRTYLLRKERMIISALPKDRARLVQNALEIFDVPTEGLDNDQKYKLVLEQIGARERRFNTTAKLVSFITLLLVLVSLYSIYTKAGETRPRLVPPTVKKAIRGDFASFNTSDAKEPQNAHYWTSDSLGVWKEVFPNGQINYFIPTSSAIVNGCKGVITEHESDGTLEVFVPNKGCNHLWLQMRRKGDAWVFVAKMNDIVEN